MDVRLYGELDKAWKSTCRILLGEDLGELKEYKEWLSEYFPRLSKRKSCVSGKDVTVALDHYCTDANFISLNEAKTVKQLNINEIKDIDSLLEAVSEKWRYCGNKVLGTSDFLDSADIAVDSRYIADGVNLQNVTHSFLAFNAAQCRYLFGSGVVTDGEFLVKFTRANNNRRCFESTLVSDCSDLYFSHHCYGCHDVMFSFHQWNRRNCIGNLVLPKEKYTTIKKKLLAEIAGELRKNKRFLSIYDLVPDEKLSSEVRISAVPKKDVTNISPIEKSFSSTFKVVFKKEPLPMSELEPWLSKRIVTSSKCNTQFGAKTTHPNYEDLGVSLKVPKQRIVTYAEAVELGKLHVGEQDAESLEKIKEWLAKVGCFTAEYDTGVNTNVIDSVIVRDSSNIYKNTISIQSESAALNSWALHSKHVFGCHWVFQSQFSINCYNSRYLNRCAELDSCARCSDTYFSHNCEGLSDSMFCFNIKGKRNAVGNLTLAPDKYAAIKNSLLEQITGELEKKHSLAIDIYNIGCMGNSRGFTGNIAQEPLQNGSNDK